MTSAQFDVDGVLIVDDASDARHRRVNQPFFLAQRPSILAVGKWTWVWEEAHVANGEVAAPGNVDVAVVVEMRATDVAVDTDGAVALGLPPNQLRVSDILQPDT